SLRAALADHLYRLVAGDRCSPAGPVEWTGRDRPELAAADGLDPRQSSTGPYPITQTAGKNALEGRVSGAPAGEDRPRPGRELPRIRLPAARRDRPMRICLLSTEIFAWGKYGGFGRATRTIGRELARRGLAVSAIVPRRPGQQAVESLNDITVLSYPMGSPWQVAGLCRAADADIYHSQEPSTATWFALRAMPDRRHVVTFGDPRDWSDWRTELAHPSLSQLQVVANFMYEDNPLVHRAVRRADRRYCAAHCIQSKVVAKYSLQDPPPLLPTPVEIPSVVRKAPQPTVCYLARWDRRKRPHLFFDLVERFPGVRFLAVGRSRDAAYDRSLRERYGHLSNLELTGFVDQFGSGELSAI